MIWIALDSLRTSLVFLGFTQMANNLVKHQRAKNLKKNDSEKVCLFSQRRCFTRKSRAWDLLVLSKMIIPNMPIEKEIQLTSSQSMFYY